MKLDVEVALRQYVSRSMHNVARVINSKLPAGSPMHYYCRYCGVETEVLPELHVTRPKTCCDPCEVLVAHGLMDEAAARAKDAIRDATFAPADSKDG